MEEESAFKEWLASYPTYAQSKARVAGDAAAGKAQFAVCSSCHGVQAEGNPALNAPKLAGQGDWYLKRQLKNFKNGARGTHEKDVFGKMMAPMAATLADDAAIDNVVAYIKTLPDNPAPATVQKNAAHGQKLYVTCAACHGPDGRGILTLNAMVHASAPEITLLRASDQERARYVAERKMEEASFKKLMESWK